jgi:hypothetical protein
VAAEEAVVLLLKVASGVVGVVEQAKKLEGEVAEEEDRLLQEVAARVLTRWVAKAVVQAGQHFHGEAEVVAFLQQQGSKLGRKNLLEVVEEGHPNEQVAEVGLKKHVCPRKEVVRGICLYLLKAAATRHRLPKESSEVEVEEEDLELLSWSHGSSKVS